ncbi:MAG: SAM-dependent chlorinase/fluorinase [Acidimicrobiales bacterium]|nr:SAM-dependent chlorinase/fluorinase [Acidimicrobiales bacterium]MDP7258373.1 SAM-dependent chlorinase/fluorinase [Acidimicrobiales bacterium]HJO80477.1 SAM-dependent chlorinase/fluorinase [Acidimicrobiales bacterium]
MGRRYDTLSFLSDYGTDDEFVGIVHSVIRSIAPHLTTVDITHGIPAHDVRAGGLTLARSAQYLCPGVVLAVVDPGVATSRRAVVVEVGDGESVLVGPDNGLLAPAVAMVGGASRAVSLTCADYHLSTPGPTFAGRDIFAPVAAHVANGVDLVEFGEDVDPSTLLPGVMPVATTEDDGLHTEVLWVDRFGNIQLNVGPDELSDIVGQIGGRCQIRISGLTRPAVRVVAFDEVPAGSIGLLVDSYGLATLVVDRASAAMDLVVSAGDRVVLAPVGDEPDAVTKVELGRNEPT